MIIGIVLYQGTLEPAQEILGFSRMFEQRWLRESAHMRRLARAFVARVHKAWMLIRTRSKVYTSIPAR